MIELTQARKKNGRYTSKKTFYKNRRVWFEVMCLANIAIWGGFAADLHPVAEAFFSPPIKYEFVNPIREPLDDSPLRGNASGDTGETVKAVSEREPRESEEAGNPTLDHSPSSVEAKIREVFEEDSSTAIKIFKCESWRDGRYHTDIVGDKDLAFTHNGQLYGRSIGVAQIRTGGIEKNGKIWVASDNVAEFEEKMKNPNENLKMARAKYDASVKRNGNGWYPWMNCAKKVGAI